VQSRRSLLHSMYPELREGADNLREQPTMDIHSFMRRVRRVLRVHTSHVWRRDDRCVVSCVEMQDMSPWNDPHHLEDSGFQPPTLVMVANLLRGMCHPDQDQTMAVLSEMIQTGLYTQELLRVVYM